MKNLFIYIKKKAPHFFGDLAALIFGIGIALALYNFGMQYPLKARLTGDAYEYLDIATHFKNLNSALGYMGDRSIGMPLFDYLFKPANLNSTHFTEDWLSVICGALLLIHFLASLIAVKIATSYTSIKSRNGLRFLFVFLVSFPAFIGHTTTPLTDTLAVDLSLFLLAGMIWSLKVRPAWGSVIAALTGLLSAYICLLRPAYLFPMIATLALYGILSVIKKKNMAILLLLAFAGILGSESLNCHSMYGRICLQDPSTFEAVRHAQMGLRGGRLMWSHEFYENDEFPVVPDAVLQEQFYDRCKLQKIIGLDNSSLTGCLMERPLLIPVYLIKKWIGLFDNFRFQPYIELETPEWLVNLSRAYDSIAWIGFLFALSAGIQIMIHWRKIQNIDPSVLAYIVFITLMLAEHTILHPEDRFGLVLIPASAVSFILFAENICDFIKNRRWKQLILPIFAAIISVGIFVLQISAWDNVHF